jgi:hypothetical protein
LLPSPSILPACRFTRLYATAIRRCRFYKLSASKFRYRSMMYWTITLILTVNELVADPWVALTTLIMG